MKKSFSKQLNALAAHAHQKDGDSNALKYVCLLEIAGMPLPKSSFLITYFEALLYLLAYPSSPVEHALVEKEIRRIKSFLRREQNNLSKLLQNTGLPYGTILTHFSHDTSRWLLSHADLKTEIDSFAETKINLSELLFMTLPTTEKHIAESGLESHEIMDTLLVSKKNRLAFILKEFSRLDQQPQVKDTLFDQLGIYLKVNPKGPGFSKASNRLAGGQIYYHNELLSRFDHQQLIQTPLSKPKKLTDSERTQAIQVVKNSMLLTVRETDPTTHLQPGSFRIYALDRGIAIALYGMEASRQLPFESYVGYTVFKNGLPVSYGGSWIFGERAIFGINIFEPFRKGESGYIMTQLLRVYKNVFDVNYFEVEPYQYGLDNPEGITSGAFWFYYKYGFRPVDKILYKKAEREREKIKKNTGYRTGVKTLVEFTESNICLKLGNKVPPSVPSVTSKITRMIQRSFNGDRARAERESIAEFKLKTGIKRVSEPTSYALNETALWAKALNISDQKRLSVMAKMVNAKSRDMYAYQKLLLKLLTKL